MKKENKNSFETATNGKKVRLRNNIIGFFVIVILSIGAFRIPGVIFSYFDENKMNQVEYEEKQDGKYEIIEYKTMEEKMVFLASCGESVKFDALKMQSVADEDSKERLRAVAQTEIQEYFYSVMSQDILSLDSYEMENPCLYTLYSAEYEVTGISFWSICFTGDSGEIKILMDSDFEKIYCISLEDNTETIFGLIDCDYYLNSGEEGWYTWEDQNWQYYNFDGLSDGIQWSVLDNEGYFELYPFEVELMPEYLQRYKTINMENELDKLLEELFGNNEYGSVKIDAGENVMYKAVAKFIYGEYNFNIEEPEENGDEIFYSKGTYLTTSFSVEIMSNKKTKICAGISSLIGFLEQEDE